MATSIADVLHESDELQLLWNEPLARHTGFSTGGSADCVALPKTRGALLLTIKALRSAGVRYYILGNGSNVLAADEGFRGCIVKTSAALSEISILDDGRLVCGAGVQLGLLCSRCAEKGLSGLEFAFGIPGTVGGAVYMNAGAYGGEMKDVVTSVEVLDKDGEIRTIAASELGFAYRTSIIEGSGMLVLSAGLRLKPDGDVRDIRAVMNEFMGRRRDKQPLDIPSCGSTFKRPDGAYASKLIDDCGLRGASVGGAAVSTKHCGFIVNTGGATTHDILELIALVKRTVARKKGYELECEIKILEP